MLELIAANQTLDIQDVSFNLTLRSAMGGSSGSYVYGFSIPYSEKNARIFGWPYRLERFQRQTASLEGFIKYNGIYVKEGVWKATSSNGLSIKLDMVIGGGEFNTYIEGKNLPKLFDVTLTYESIVDHVPMQVANTWPEAGHNFPLVYNPWLYGDPAAAAEDAINPQYQGFINDWQDGALYVTSENNNTIVPMLYLGYMFTRIMSMAGYEIKGEVLNDTMVKAAMLYNHYTLDRLVSTSFYAEFNNGWVLITEGSVVLWDENIVDPGSNYTIATGHYTVNAEGNYVISIQFEHNEPTQPSESYDAHVEIYYNGVLIDETIVEFDPSVKEKWVINIHHEELIEYADIGHDIHVIFYYKDSGDVTREPFVYTSHINIQNSDTEIGNVFQDSFNYKNHVPDIETKTFIEGFFNTLQILPIFDHQKKEVDLILLNDMLAGLMGEDITEGLHRDSLTVYENDYDGITMSFEFAGPDKLIDNNFFEVPDEDVYAFIDTWDDIPGAPVDSILFIRSLNAYYKLRYDADLIDFVWEPYADAHTAHIIDGGDQEEVFQFAPMLMRSVKNSRLAYRTCPALYAEGISVDFKVEGEFPLRILFWHGLESAATDQYPLATTTKLSPTGAEIFPIDWTTPDIAARYWPNVIDWMKRRLKIEFDLEVLPNVIKKFDFKKKYKFLNAPAFFEEIYIKIKNNRFGPGKFTGWSG